MPRLLTASCLAVIMVAGPVVRAESEKAESQPHMLMVPRADFEAMQAKLERLEREVERLQEALGVAPTGAPEPEPAAPSAAALPAVYQTLLPDISVVGNIVGLASSDKSAADRNVFLSRELELALQGYIYPQLRADAFIALEEREDYAAHLEEGYLTFLDLASLRVLRRAPQGLSAKMGRKLLDIGKVNPIHPHRWNFVNKPLVMRNFLGVHALTGDGLSLGYLLPTATFANLELGAWRVQPEHADEGHADEETGPEFGPGFEGTVYAARLWTSRALGDVSELEVGASAARGRGYRYPGDDEGDAEETAPLRDRITLAGLDLTYKRWPAAHKRLLLQGEALWHRRRGGGEGRTSRGHYLFGNYQWDRYWDAGVLYNWSERPFPEDGHESALSAILTNRLTETTALRLQYDYARRPGAGRAHEGWLQVLWGIGPHSHPLE